VQDGEHFGPGTIRPIIHDVPEPSHAGGPHAEADFAVPEWHVRDSVEGGEDGIGEAPTEPGLLPVEIPDGGPDVGAGVG
jgi:hypothetical protein